MGIQYSRYNKIEIYKSKLDSLYIELHVTHKLQHISLTGLTLVIGIFTLI